MIVHAVESNVLHVSLALCLEKVLVLMLFLLLSFHVSCGPFFSYFAKKEGFGKVRGSKKREKRDAISYVIIAVTDRSCLRIEQL